MTADPNKILTNGEHRPRSFFDILNNNGRGFGRPKGDVQELIANALLSRKEFFDTFFDPRRNIDDECGYPSGIGFNAQQYQGLYEREPIAARVVDLLPKECWQVQPNVYESEDPEQVTSFEEAWDSLGKTIRGEDSHYKEEQGSPVWEYLQRLDEQSGIGRYGVLLIGIDDGLPLDRPAFDPGFPDSVGPFATGGSTSPIFPSAPQAPSGIPQGTGDSTDPKYFHASTMQPDEPEATSLPQGKPQRKLLFLRVFPEALAQIVQFENNIYSPRFGHPVMYQITFNDPRSPNSGVGLPTATVNVHWTRIIHAADNLRSSEVFGTPRMQPVLNRLLDLRKLYAGSAEMYWRGAFFGLSLETHPTLGGDVEVDPGEMRDAMEQYMNGLQRYLLLTGMSAKTLAPAVVDPTPQIEVQLNAICIQSGIPMRIFKGSERGELASSQDDGTWNDRKRERQQQYITPRIIVPFIDRLIALGILPEPTEAQEVPEGSEGYSEATSDTETDTTYASPATDDEAKSPTGNRRRKKKKRRYKTVKVYNAETNQIEEKIIEEETPKSDATGPSTKVEKGYCVEWPDLDAQTESEKADIAVKKTNALSAYVSGTVEQVYPLPNFLTDIMGLEDAHAQDIVSEAEKIQEEVAAEEEAMAAEQGFKPEAPEGFVDPEMEEMEKEVAMEKAKNGKGGPPPPSFGGKRKGGRP